MNGWKGVRSTTGTHGVSQEYWNPKKRDQLSALKCPVSLCEYSHQVKGSISGTLGEKGWVGIQWIDYTEERI